MLKFIVVLYRKAGWERGAFLSYLADVHGPLARQMPGLVRYVQNHAADDPTRRPPDWDAVVELSWPDRESMEAAWLSAAGVAATADLARFADLARTSWSIVEEHWARAGRRPSTPSARGGTASSGCGGPL
jgi:uncharacterized protein (TIGR02118 family)